MPTGKAMPGKSDTGSRGPATDGASVRPGRVSRRDSAVATPAAGSRGMARPVPVLGERARNGRPERDGAMSGRPGRTPLTDSTPARPVPDGSATQHALTVVEAGSEGGVAAPERRWWHSGALSLGWLLVVGFAVVITHLAASVRVAAETATLGEMRFAVAMAVARGAGVVADPLPLTDRFAALQLAVVQTVLPVGGLPVVDAARWTVLLVGAATALLLWPVLRGLAVSAPAAAVGVALAGASTPALVLHSGIGAGAPACFWIVVAAALAVHGRGLAAVAAALVAVLTAPMASVVLLALLAHLVLDRTVHRTVRYRVPLAVGLGVAAVVAALLSVGAAPWAGAAGPEIGTTVAVTGVAVGLLLVLLAARAEPWLGAVFTSAAVVLVVGLVPGPSRAVALLLAVPAVAVSAAVLVGSLGERLGRRRAAFATGSIAAALVVLLLVAGAGPLTRPVPSTGGPDLVAWLLSESVGGAPIRADALDRAELLAAGIPAARLLDPDDPPAEGELVLVADRPSAGLAGPGSSSCGEDAVVATTSRGTGGAPATVCRTDGGGATVTAERPARARLGASLADNPALTLAPPAEAALRTGAVDPRLMLVLAAMTTAHEIGVADFPAVDLDSPAIPRRRVLLDSVDGTDPAGSELLRTWLSAQQAPFVPALVEPDGAALLVGYPVPPPGGLLPG